MILDYIVQFHPTGFGQILQKSGLYDFNIKKILKVHLYRLARNKKMDLKLYQKSANNAFDTISRRQLIRPIAIKSTALNLQLIIYH